MQYTGNIILSYDIFEKAQSLKDEIASRNEIVRDFVCEEVKMEDAHAIIAQAYIAEKEKKTIIIAAQNFRNEAQNALLKILEEPPQNIHFIIITRNKTALLPTIRSRLVLEDLREKSEIASFGLDITRLDLGKIFDFLKNINASEGTKTSGKEMVESLLIAIHKAGIKLSEEELEMFDNALLELHNYRRISLVITPLLLMLLLRQKTNNTKRAL
ncbi:hypothetical protein HMPREF2086_00482 [Helicobacter macacae MIT 99-5501]|uniref:DNA polymerase III subunit delta n=2 Tax=Helicobacter TaxID=209 RepID=V8CDG5_9HELI|nr:hypothetical protein HMPREF2086_00482 [Helicobacter macacae MIT 99-5501]